MPEYRRAFVRGGTFFFTVVTYSRAPLFRNPLAQKLLRETLHDCQQRWPFEIIAVVLLPDHLHTIWCLPAGDADFSRRWAWLKKSFTQRWLAEGGRDLAVSEGKERDGRKGVWQPKFWEHCIRNVADLEAHLNYIHYNPVKHGYASCPHAWPYSTFSNWVAKGLYEENWACCCDGREAIPPGFGELRLNMIE